jgi:hypothetical protein
MKNLTFRILIVIFVIGFCMGSALISIAPKTDAEALGTWNSTTSYPFSVAGGSCVTSGGYIYCVGGFDYATFAYNNSTYYAQLSSSGIGSWKLTTVYPTNVYLPSCVTSGGYIYCVGGGGSVGTVTSAVYFAPLSSSGIGSWSATNSLPVGLESTSCTAYNGYIYCVGGITYAVSPSQTNTNATYYAKLSSSGVGSWSTSTSYPTNIQLSSCISSDGYIYCVGGQYDPNVSNYVTNATYYATVSSSGIGSWMRSANYSFIGLSSESCVASSQNFIYCVGGYPSVVGGTAFYGQLSSSGINSWTSASAYPTYVEIESCVVNSAYLYCIGGYTNATYYSLIGSTSSSTSTTSTTTTPPSTTSSTSSSFTSSTAPISSSSSSSTSSALSTTASSSSPQASSQSSTLASSTTTSASSIPGTTSSPNNSTLYIAIGVVVVIGGISAGLYLRRGRGS